MSLIGGPARFLKNKSTDYDTWIAKRVVPGSHGDMSVKVTPSLTRPDARVNELLEVNRCRQSWWFENPTRIRALQLVLSNKSFG